VALLALTPLFAFYAGGDAEPPDDRLADRPLQACKSASARLRLDHVAIAVRDLHAARSTFGASLGFALKPGRLHANGLENAHIGLALGPTAELAHTHRTASVDWVSFPERHPLHSVFFVHVRSRAPDLAEHLSHANGARGLSDVWVETDHPGTLADLLLLFGAVRCGKANHEIGLSGTEFGLAGGSLIAVPREKALGYPRVLAVTLDASRPGSSIVSSGVWLARRAESE
jgi:hypothetical protein